MHFHTRQESCNHDRPGNVRELQNVIQRCLAVKRLAFLGPERTVRGLCAAEEGAHREDGSSDRETEPGVRRKGNIANLEKAHIRQALARSRGNKSRAADHLGISRKPLPRKHKRSGPL